MKVSGSETGCSKAWNWVFQALKLFTTGTVCKLQHKYKHDTPPPHLGS